MFRRITCLFGQHARSHSQVWDDNLNLRSICRHCGRDMIEADQRWRLLTHQDEDPGREEYPMTVSKERRVESRHPARREAVLYWSGISESVVVTNISPYGAMLVGGRFPALGTHVSLAIAGKNLAATVAWSGDEKCGLMLHERIDPATFVGAPSDTRKQAGRPDRSRHI